VLANYAVTTNDPNLTGIRVQIAVQQQIGGDCSRGLPPVPIINCSSALGAGSAD
jgi:hypothetical protein